jgi:hypothetical protein
MLTGRGETNFADLINRICNSKGLDFDLVVLKPEVGPSGQHFEHTIGFKQEFLKELVCTYKNSEEIKIYEDRPKHVKGFREYFEKLNKSLLSHPANQPPPPRKPINAEVIHVCELKATLNPETEVEVVQKAVQRHNHAIAQGEPTPTATTHVKLKISESFIYFGYLINSTDSARLISLCGTQPHLIDSGEVRLLATCILIAPYYPRKDLVKKVGGRGKKVTWQVTGYAKYDDRIWAARVAPVTETQIVTQDPTAMVVLAIRKGSRQVDAQRIVHWEAVAPEKAFMFETTVGDKVMLSLEDDHSRPTGGQRQGALGDATNKRKFGHEENRFRGNQTYSRAAAGGAERDDGSWVPKERPNHGGGRFAQKLASKANFNNKNNPNGGGARNRENAPQDHGNHFRARQGNTGPGGNRNAGRGGGGGGGCNGGGGGGGAGQGGANTGNRGYAAYKSLDDYGSGNFDGANDSKAGAVNAEMVMNY